MKKNIFKINEISIPYEIYTYCINDNLFRTTFVFYTSNIPTSYHKYLKIIINGFSINTFYSSKYSNNNTFDSKYNNEIVIVYDDNYDLKNNIDLEYDFNYIKKRFIKNSNNLKFSDKSIIVSDDFLNMNFNDEETNKNLLIKRFNLISGLNGAGKTMYLKILSSLFESNLYDIMRNIYNNNKKIGSSEKVLYEIDKLLFSEINNYDNFLLLIDNIPWHLLDNKNKINVIDKLFEFSMDEKPIYITSVDNDIKTLTKRRIYNPNFIDL